MIMVLLLSKMRCKVDGFGDMIIFFKQIIMKYRQKTFISGQCRVGIYSSSSLVCKIVHIYSIADSRQHMVTVTLCLSVDS